MYIPNFYNAFFFHNTKMSSTEFSERSRKLREKIKEDSRRYNEAKERDKIRKRKEREKKCEDMKKNPQLIATEREKDYRNIETKREIKKSLKLKMSMLVGVQEKRNTTACPFTYFT